MEPVYPELKTSEPLISKILHNELARFADNLLHGQEILDKYSFKDIKSHKYTVKKVFSSQDYIRLLDTYSDHSVIPERDKSLFYAQVKNVIDKNGGCITVVYTNVLVVGKK